MLIMASALLATPAYAGFGRADAEVAARSLSFLNGLSGTLEMQVLYDPASAASRADAEAAVSAFSGVKTAKLAFHPTLTPIGSIGKTDVAYVSNGLAAHYSAIASASSNHRLLTITNDHECIVAKACAMYVSASPSVTIEISQAAFNATSFTLPASLKMMIKEMP